MGLQGVQGVEGPVGPRGDTGPSGEEIHTISYDFNYTISCFL